MDLKELDAAPGPRLAIDTSKLSDTMRLSVDSVRSEDSACTSPEDENESLLGGLITGDAAFEGIPELKRSSTPTKSRWSYFSRVLWLDLPDDDWEDEAFIDEAFIDETYRLAEGSTAEGSTAPQTPAAGSTAPTVKTGGMNLRCVCWLMNLIILAVLCAAGSYSLKQPESSKFTLWLSLNVLGFGYVSRVTERRPWFLSRFGNFTEICKVLALTPIIYPLGPMHTLQPAAAADGLTRFLLPNLLWYILPFFVGLNWTHLQRWKPLRGISLSPAGLQELAKRPKAAVVVAASLPAVLCAVIYHVRLMASAPHPYLYVAYVVVLVVSVAVVSWVVRATHEVHLHHFFTTCVLIPLTSFRNPVSAACQALLGGIYIEGAARFGMGYFVDQWSRRDLGYRTELTCCCIPLH